MNPLEQSLTEQLLDEHSKAQTRRIAAWIGHSPERFEALMCFRFVDAPGEAAAIRAFAMTVLARICRREPALNDEFRLVLETHYEQATAAFRSRARKILKELANAGK